MKLKNKKTGEIVEVITGDTFEVGGIQIRSMKRDPQIVRYYPSLAELNEEWEDYEEPKKYWFINSVGGVIRPSDTTDWVAEDDAYHKAIGNYFETKEEAEKAVEKLEAWKRLKDEGMRTFSFKREKRGIDLDYYTLTILAPRDKESLDLLFGGEE